MMPAGRWTPFGLASPWRRVAFGIGLVGVAALVFGLDPIEAFARVGGGDSYGGGGGGRGGGGGSGDGAIVWLLIELVRFLIILTFEHPAIGIPLDILFIVIVIVVWRSKARRRGRPRSAGTSPTRPARSSAARRSTAIAMDVERLREEDANFSRPLLLDFVQLLYTRTHEARGRGDLAPLAPYLSAKVRELLLQMSRQPAPTKVDAVVIGASRIVEIGGWGTSHRGIAVEFEANYTEHHGDDAKTLYTRERWVFRRRAGVLSKGPGEIAALRCPSCGAAVELSTDGRCPYCHNVVDRGDFHWLVVGVTVLERRARRSHELHLGGGVEVGTDLPTVVQPQLGATLRALQTRDPAFSFEVFQRHVAHVFRALQKAWSDGDWGQARAHETDHLFTTHRFAQERFRAEGLRNRLEQVEIQRIVLAKVEQDAYHDAVTVRVFASMIDVMVDDTGKVVSGDPKRPRVFSEYWTFIRSAGQASDPDRDPATCPSCGAAMQVDQAGVCAYCGTKVATGQFGWVLSAIEQDEVYGG